MPEIADLLALLPVHVPFPLVQNAHSALTYPQPDSAFVPPPLRLAYSPPPNTPSPFLVIAAPGAVGKTALAHELAARSNSCLWDLSRIRVGDNTFVGTIAQAFGPALLSNILDSLASGTTVFFFDAFDEAEILSGWSDVERFISELWRYGHSATKPCFILLARSDTAALINMHLDDLGNQSRLYRLYEIDYFDQDRAEQFIVRHLDRRLGPAAPHRQHSGPFRQALHALLDTIYQALTVSSDQAWQLPESRSFLGYAPVLQAVGSYLASFDNYHTAVDEFRTSGVFSPGTNLISALMAQLLEREQKKLLVPLRQRLPQSGDWAAWDALYGPDEQIERIFYKVSKDQRTFQPRPSVTLPSWLAEPYLEALRAFLPQHAFIREDDYAGPAFRDYVLAQLLRRPALAGLPEPPLNAPTYVPTPLLAQFYLTASSEPVMGRHVGYLYEAMSARHGLHGTSQVIIVSPEHVGASLSGDDHLLEIFDAAGTDTNATPEQISVALDVSEEDPIIFPRYLRHAYLWVRGPVILGRESQEFELTDVELHCTNLDIRSSSLLIRCPDATETVLEADRYRQSAAALKLEVKGNGTVRAMFPGAERYPWTTHNRPGTSDEFIDRASALLAARKILTWFRKDRRADFARYRLLIDNVAVGDHPLRAKMLGYLLHRQILVDAGSLYKLNQDRATEFGINWTQLRQGQITGDIARFLDGFLEWSRAS